MTDPGRRPARIEGTQTYAFDRPYLREAAVVLDTEAERLTERLQIGLTSERDRRAIVERRATCWRTAKLLRELIG